MAFPFGGHPTFAMYMQWARETHQCKAASGFAADSSGKTHTVTQITAPDGKSVAVVGTKQTEHLAPTMVGYLDRRLGIESPWFSIDAGDDP